MTKQVHTEIETHEAWRSNGRDFKATAEQLGVTVATVKRRVKWQLVRLQAEAEDRSV